MIGLCKAGILGYTANPSAAWGIYERTQIHSLLFNDR
jgi:hypothetical protein